MVRGIGHNVSDIIFNPKRIEDTINNSNHHNRCSISKQYKTTLEIRGLETHKKYSQWCGFINHLEILKQCCDSPLVIESYGWMYDMWWWSHNQPHPISLSHLTWTLVHIWSHSQPHHPTIKKNTQSLVQERKKEIIKHHLYSLNLNYYICIMSGLYGSLFKKTPNNHNIIHPHSWTRRVLTCYFCLYDPTPWTLSPHITPYQEEWKKLHHVDKL